MGDTGGGTSTGDREDQYYRELLARVDNAIVETREAAPDRCDLEGCCKSCVQRSIGMTLVLAAIVTECCVSLKMLVMGTPEYQTPSTNRPAQQQAGSQNDVNAQGNGFEL